jgi:glycosyltransferase involved in cell wall biosynthesis
MLDSPQLSAAPNDFRSLVGSQPSRLLNIAVVTETYPPEINGVANTLKYTVAGMLSRGHRVHVIRPRQQGDDQPSRRTAYSETLVNGFGLPMYRELRFGSPARFTIGKLWKQQRPDVIYISTEGPLGFAALMAALNHDIPVVSGFHTHFENYSRYYHLGILENLILGYLRFFHNRTRRTLVPTAALAADLRAKKFQNISIFPRGVDTELFSPARRRHDLRRQWGVGEDDIVVLYVGRLAAEKNLKLAEQAFRQMQRQHDRLRFVLVGDGPERGNLETQNPDFVFCGNQTGETLAEHYASGDVFLFPSMSETYGNVILEALASGLPVIGYDYASLAEVIRDAENGYTAPLGNEAQFIKAAQQMVRKPDSIRAMSVAARHSVEGVGWQHLHDLFETILYRQVMPGGEHDQQNA